LTASNGAILLALLTCLLPGTVPARAAVIPVIHREDRVHHEIQDLEQVWRQGVLENSVPTATRLLADDYLGINPNGTLETKADALAARRSSATRVSRLDPVTTKIRVYGDTAVVTSVVEITATRDGADISGRYHYTRVYSRRHGEWKIVSFEASRLNGK